LTNAASLTGKIVLVQRGTCAFSTKVAMAAAAGAIGCIVGNNIDEAPIQMGKDGANSEK
jgi:hypothetical protein